MSAGIVVLDGADAASPAPIVQANAPAGSSLLIASRFRGFGNSLASAARIYVGVPDLGTGGNRTETTPNGYVLASATNQVRFTYDPAAAGGAAVTAQMTNTRGTWSPAPYTLPAQPLRPSLNVLAIRVRLSSPAHTAVLTNVTLTPSAGAGIPLGSFSSTGLDRTWLIVDPNPAGAPALFASGFTLTGDLVLTNGTPAFGACSEGCKLELTAGVLPADMRATTTAPATVTVGDSVTVSGTCTNDGATAGSGAPPPTIASPAPAPTCVLGGLPVGASQVCSPSPAPDALIHGATITCTSTFVAAATGSLTVATAAGSAANDPAPANNTASETVTINAPPQADVAVSKADGAVTVTAGDPVTYTIAVTNNGPAPVSGVQVTDTLPATLTAATWTCSASTGSSCPASGTDTIATSAVSLLAGGTATFTLTATVAPTATGTLSNTATATVPAGTNDPTPANNTATDTSTATPPPPQPAPVANLSASVVVTSDGDSASVVVQAANAGPDPSPGTTLVITLPSGASVVSSTVTLEGVPIAAQCETEGALVSCALGVVPAGGVIVVRLRVELDPATEPGWIVQASITGGATDPVPSNNAASDTTQQEPEPPAGTGPARFVLAKVALTPRVRPGDRARFRITVRNTGASPARNVVVCDVPPRATTLVSAPGATMDRGRACWRLPRLGAGKQSRLSVVLRVDALARPGVVRNVAILKGARRAVARIVVFGKPRPGRGVGVTG